METEEQRLIAKTVVYRPVPTLQYLTQENVVKFRATHFVALPLLSAITLILTDPVALCFLCLLISVRAIYVLYGKDIPLPVLLIFALLFIYIGLVWLLVKIFIASVLQVILHLTMFYQPIDAPV
jgi:hypothetical protein